MERTLLQRIHNPRNYECACDPDCWCRNTTLGRLVKWWMPARYFSFFGLHHTNRRLEEWKRSQPPGALERWKRGQQERMDPIVEVQPKYESIVRLGPMRFGMSGRLADGTTVVHELGPRLSGDGF